MPENELPKCATRKLDHLRQLRDKAQYVLNGITGNVADLRKAMTNPARAGMEAEDERQLSDLVNRQATQQAEFRTLADLIARLDDFLLRNRNARMSEYLPSRMRHEKGEASAVVKGFRKELHDLTAKRSLIKHAGIPHAEKKERLSDWVLMQRARGMQALKVSFPDGSLPNVTFDLKIEGGFTNASDVKSMLACISPKAMTTFLHDWVDQQPESLHAMPSSDRDTHVISLSERILALERRIEETISHAETKGQFIARRVNADPLAVLEIEIDAVPKIAAVSA